MKRPKIGLVVQRCGTEVCGGAEALCLAVATRLAASNDVEVLTTRALDYMSWADHYPAGVEMIGDVSVRRFSVDAPRDVTAFNAASGRLHGRRERASIEESEAWMRAQGPVSSTLAAHLMTHADSFDAIVFYTYLYATTYFLLPKVADKAFLVSLVHHNEWTLDLPIWPRFFNMPQRILANTVEEMELLSDRFPSARVFEETVALGVDEYCERDPKRFRDRFGLDAPYLLYVGRIDPSKGVDTLLADFISLKQAGRIPHKLVLLGRAAMELPEHPDIIVTGFVEESCKWDAMEGCDWLINPSPYESLSMVLLETWLCRRPTLVTAQSPVMVGQSRRAAGGLWYAGAQELADIVTGVSEADKRGLGEQGRAFVLANYSWPVIEDKYRRALFERG